MVFHDTQASSDRSENTLKALLANPPPKSSNVSATLDVAEIKDSETEAYTNVGDFTSPPVLVVEVSANIAMSSNNLVIGQTTRITPGRSVGHASAPAASGQCSSSGATPSDVVSAQGMRIVLLYPHLSINGGAGPWHEASGLRKSVAQPTAACWLWCGEIVLA